MNTLVLTATITPLSSIENKSSLDLNVDKRKKDYIRSLLYYISQSNFDNIIFCENSSTNIPEFEALKTLACTFEKNLEILLFQWDQSLAINHGYGAWEAEILDYIFEHSHLLKSSDSFIKITWRYILKDINEITEWLKSVENYFHKQWLFMTQFTFSTAFFKISKENYEKYLYKKQIKCYQQIAKKDYKNKFFFRNHFPLERLWYCLMRKVILTTSQEKSFPIIYSYPISYSHGLNSSMRDLFYRVYCFLRLNHYWLLHKIFDKAFFKKVYWRLINDRLIDY